MLRLDRTVHSAGKITDPKKETDYYLGYNLEQIGEVFAYLQSVAYNYPLGKSPKIDKTVFSSR